MHKWNFFVTQLKEWIINLKGEKEIQQAVSVR